MIIPSIDLMAGNAVQLIGGRVKALDAGDPFPIARQFGMIGEIAVIDLDAALGKGTNRNLIEKLVATTRCRVGGGIRDFDSAMDWLDIGARKIIMGTAATRELLARLPQERTIVALDCLNGEVVVDGWRTKTGRSVAERIIELRDVTGGFLVTFVEREGQMKGIDIAAAARLKEITGRAALTVAGGVSTVEEIRDLDKLGIDVQVGMALYTGRFSLADAFLAPMDFTDESTIWPTVVVDEHGMALGLTWSNHRSVEEALKRQAGVYWSRKRGLWIKGELSGNRQELLQIDVDCDRDSLRCMVRQHGHGFCHTGMRSCWDDDHGIHKLARRLRERQETAPAGSYTKRLLNDRKLLRSKLLEEAQELIEAETPEHTVQEAADLLYFTMVLLTAGRCSLENVSRELDRRELRVKRRPGNAKAERI